MFTEGEGRVVGDGAEVVQVAGGLRGGQSGESGCEEGGQKHGERSVLKVVTRWKCRDEMS